MQYNRDFLKIIIQSQWFIITLKQNCIRKSLIEKHHLPINAWCILIHNIILKSNSYILFIVWALFLFLRKCRI